MSDQDPTAERPVAVGVDGTEGTRGALRFAALEASRREAELRIVHVPPRPHGLPREVSGEVEQRAEAVVADAAEQARQAAPGVQVETHVASAAPVPELVRASADAAMLVLGRRESSRLVDRLLGGTTGPGAVARCTPPALVVPGDWTGDTAVPRRLVVAVKGTVNDAPLLEVAAGLAAEYDVGLLAVHCWRIPEAYIDTIEQRVNAAAWEAAAQRLLGELVEPLEARHPGVRVESLAVHGRAVPVVVDLVEPHDLMLLPRRRRTAGHPWALGGITRTLLRAAGCPMLVVPVAPGAAGEDGLDAGIDEVAG